MGHSVRDWLAIPFAIALAGCAMTSGGLTSSAERLERNAAAFERQADDRGAQRDAQELTEEARDFRSLLRDRDADDREVREAFEDLSRRYHATRDEVERGNDAEAERAFASVTDAYLDLERAMNASEDRSDRYARD